MSDELPSPEKQIEILNGGVEIEIHYKDGQTEVVKIKHLSVRESPQLAALLSDEYKQVALYCGKPFSWVDTITDESIETVLGEGQRLNFPRLGRWLARQKALVEVMGQGAALEKLNQEVLEKAIRGQ